MLRRFFSFVQIYAKLTGFLTFLLGLCYTVYMYHRVSVGNTLLFFVSMAAFELSITGLNNTIDARKNPEALPISRSAAWKILSSLWIVAAVTALILAFQTDVIVLICGALCFAVGIFYSFGPAPISHLPLGELFSGVFEGFFILFLIVYINAPAGSLVRCAWGAGTLEVTVSVFALAKLVLLSLPCVIGTANIMLANNICDLAQDIKNGRYTLPRYLGKKWSLRLFAVGYYAAFIAVIASVVFGILPVYALVTLVTLFFVQRNISVFFRWQDKSTTFFGSVINLVLLIAPMIICLGIAFC